MTEQPISSGTSSGGATAASPQPRMKLFVALLALFVAWIALLIALNLFS